MRRSRPVIVAFAVVASVLVVTAMPATASHGLATVSIHTTDTEFNNADTLDNVTVSGSGDSATVGLQTENQYGTTVARDADDNSGSQTDRRGIAINPNTDLAGVRFNLSANTDGGTTAYVTQTDGTVINSTSISGNSGETVEILADLSSGTTFYITIDAGGSSYTVGSGSNPSFPYSSSDVDITAGVFSDNVEADTGAWNIINVTAVTSSGNNDEGTYISQNHTAGNTEQAFVNITEITNATATVTWETNDGSGWATLNQTTGITTPANHTFSWANEPNSTVRVNVTVFNQSGNGAPAFTLADEGVQFTAAEPAVDNSSATPTGGLSTAQPTFNISIDDADFPLAQGDSVTAELFIDGVSNGTDTLTSNGTASVQASQSLTGGDHTYHWEVTDSYGHTVTSETFTISTPDTLFIRNESAPDQLVDNATVEITFFGDEGTVITRSTDDGTIDMTGLPVDEKFVAVSDASGFHSRRVIIDSLFEQQSIYLLNDSVTAVAIDFEIDDATGEFTGDNVEILVQRPLNRSGNTTWETIVGDEVGANGQVPTLLEQDVRYRIIVRNDQESRVLGSYVASGPKDPEVLPIGQVQIDGDTQAQTAFGASMLERSDGSRDIQLSYFDAQDVTTELDLLIYNVSDPSDELLNTTIQDPTQRHVETIDVPASAPDDAAYVVQYNATRDGEADVSGTVRVGSVGKLFGDVPIDPAVLEMFGWVGWFAVTGWFALRSPVAAPAASVLFATALTLLGVIFVHPVILGIAGAIGVLVLVGGANP